MTLLADADILDALDSGAIDIDPFDVALLQPASVDVTLSRDLRVPDRRVTHIDTASVPAGHTRAERIPRWGYTLLPGGFLLASTEQRLALGRGHAARAEGKSSVGRLGLAVHVTAGFIDPGFAGQVTLEVVNMAPWAVTLHEGMPIAQLAFFRMSREVETPYSGRYQRQDGPVESRYTLATLHQ